MLYFVKDLNRYPKILPKYRVFSPKNWKYNQCIGAFNVAFNVVPENQIVYR